jgi:hypothetical protein
MLRLETDVCLEGLGHPLFWLIITGLRPDLSGSCFSPDWFHRRVVRSLSGPPKRGQYGIQVCSPVRICQSPLAWDSARWCAVDRQEATDFPDSVYGGRGRLSLLRIFESRTGTTSRVSNRMPLRFPDTFPKTARIIKGRKRRDRILQSRRRTTRAGTPRSGIFSTGL